RADDLKSAVQRLGQEPPSGRQLLLLKFMGLIAPPPGSSLLLRIRSVLLILALVIVLLGIGFGIVELIALPFGGIALGGGIVLGGLVTIAILGVPAVSRRRSRARGCVSSTTPTGRRAPTSWSSPATTSSPTPSCAPPRRRCCAGRRSSARLATRTSRCPTGRGPAAER